MRSLAETARCAWTKAPLVLAGAALAALAACGGGDSPTTAATPTPESKTETFTGTLTQSGSVYHPFTIAAQGSISVTLTTLSPQSTITMGLGIGTVSGTTCTLLTGAYSESAKAGSTLSGTIATGSYCVLLYDIGNMTSANDYVITVVHT